MASYLFTGAPGVELDKVNSDLSLPEECLTSRKHRTRGSATPNTIMLFFQEYPEYLCIEWKLIKRIIHTKMNILLLITHPHVVPNL